MTDKNFRTFMEAGTPSTGILLKVRGEPFPPGAELQVEKESPIGAIGQVFDILGINQQRHLQRYPDQPEGQITIDIHEQPKPDGISVSRQP